MFLSFGETSSLESSKRFDMQFVLFSTSIWISYSVYFGGSSKLVSQITPSYSLVYSKGTFVDGSISIVASKSNFTLLFFFS